MSPHTGSATFWGWLRGGKWIHTLTGALPQALPLSNNHLLPIEKALAFFHGLLCDARKLTQVAYLRRDPIAPELIHGPVAPLWSSRRSGQSAGRPVNS